MTTTISRHWVKVQPDLIAGLEELLGPLSDEHERLVIIIEFADVAKVLNTPYYRGPGRPPKDRASLAHAFIAKSHYNYTENKQIIEKLQSDSRLRRICGWDRKSQIPSESVFSRVFAEFAKASLVSKILDSFTKKYHSERLVGHVSRDSTAIEAREKAAKKETPVETPKPEKKKRGRRKKGEEKPAPEPTRLELQRGMRLPEMLANLPSDCDIGCKKNAKGFKTTWKGYKLHVDTIDGDIPVSAILTSASVHDSQVNIPLATMTEQKITYLYELMDAAYDSATLRERAEEHNHVALIDFNHRSPNDTRTFTPPEKRRYKKRSSAERLNGNLKDNYGCQLIRVKGNEKVFTHLMFGVLCIAIEQSLRWLT